MQLKYLAWNTENTNIDDDNQTFKIKSNSGIK